MTDQPTVLLPRWRFTADEYEQMGVTGIFNEDDRVELLGGDVITMNPVGSRHVSCVNRLTMLLAPLLVGRAVVQIQSPVKLETYWEPQPDVVVLRLRDDYPRHLPTGADVRLLIEVADSSLAYDRAKWPAYARAGISEAWLVNIQDEIVLCHREPLGEQYQVVQTFRRGERIPLSGLADAALAVDTIFD